MRRILAAALVLAGCTAPAPDLQVIAGARLGEIEHSVVVIEGAKIREAGPQSSIPVPKGARITGGLGMRIEPAAGGTIAPGQPADLVLRGAAADRVMKNGKWVN